MKSFTMLLLALTTISVASAQTSVNVIARTALDSNGNVVKNFTEISFEKGRWTPFDIVIIGKPDGRTSEIAIGGGLKISTNKHFTWSSELLLVKDLGEKTQKGFYLQPFHYFSGHLNHELRWQIVTIPYLALSSRSKFQFTLERARLLKDTRVGTVGIGTGGFKSGKSKFQTRPLVSFQPKGWPVDFWYQVYLPTTQSPHTRHTFQVRFSFKKKLVG